MFTPFLVPSGWQHNKALIAVGPSTPPDYVQVLPESSTVITIMWDTVPETERNGVITQYEVVVNQSTFNEIPFTRLNTTNGSVLAVEIGGLEEYVEYSIRVRAHTSVGPGPFSVAIVISTLEDGEKSNIHNKVLSECDQ